ncbi:MAG: hypothetical protein A3F68_01605 [Acidobacteria bacterium RIFCSPLOWO2_12_FULL_54_10]|nr:MAG: hypothetical protein A3F68_01605 [Acidobacteria bacterium RIFCSPLOWO2_12_FULL_54_10]
MRTGRKRRTIFHYREGEACNPPQTKEETMSNEKYPQGGKREQTELRDFRERILQKRAGVARATLS